MSLKSNRPRVIVCGGPFSGKTTLVARLRRELPHLKVVEFDEFLESRGIDKRAWRVQHPEHADFNAAHDEFAASMYGSSPLGGEDFDVFIKHNPPSQNGFAFGIPRKVIMLRPHPGTLTERADAYFAKTGDANRLIAALHWSQRMLINGITDDIQCVPSAEFACEHITAFFSQQERSTNE